MITIGLTGSIGMGKSETARLFAAEGIAVYDADAAVHKLYASGGAAVAKVKEIFPASIIKTPDGEAVDRELLAKEVLGDSEKIKQLEAAVHPLVGLAQQEFLAANKDAAMLVLDIPLLFESGAAARVDYVVVVSAPEAVQTARVLERAGMNAEKLSQIRAKQLPDAEKRARADFIVDSSKSIADAARQVRDIIKEIEKRLENA